jgi:ABC-type molybdate transport system permease subunit
MFGYIGLFDTAHNYTLRFTITHAVVSTVMSSLPLLVAASNGGHFSSSAGSQTIPGLSYQILTAADHKSWAPAVLFWGSHMIATQPLPNNGGCLQSHNLATAVM